MHMVNQLAKGIFRNALCICGSKIKMKKCHGSERMISVDQFNENNKMIHEHNVKIITDLKVKNKAKVNEVDNGVF